MHKTFHNSDQQRFSERRLVFLNKAQEALDKDEDNKKKKQTQEAAATPDEQVEQSKNDSVKKIKGTRERSLGSLLRRSEDVLDANLEKLVDDRAKNRTAAAETEMNLASKTSWGKILGIAKDSKLNIAMVASRKDACNSLMGELKPERDRLQLEVNDKKGLIQYFTNVIDPNSLPRQLEAVRRRMDGFRRIRDRYDEVSKTFEGQMYSSIVGGKNKFIDSVMQADPQTGIFVAGTINDYLLGQKDTLEDMINNSEKIPTKRKTELIKQAKELRDGPRNYSRLLPSKTTAITAGLATALSATTYFAVPYVGWVLGLSMLWNSRKQIGSGVKTGKQILGEGKMPISTRKDVMNQVVADEIRKLGKLNDGKMKDRIAKIPNLPRSVTINIRIGTGMFPFKVKNTKNNVIFLMDGAGREMAIDMDVKKVNTNGTESEECSAALKKKDQEKSDARVLRIPAAVLDEPGQLNFELITP